MFSSTLSLQNSVVMFTFADFDRKYHFWVNLVQKKQNCQFVFKFDTWSNCKNAQCNGLVHLICFRLETPFLGKFCPKTWNCWFILKFGTWTNSNMQNPIAMFNFSVFYWNYHFWANLVQLIKIFRLS